MKFATSLLFVLLQVTLFCVGVFLCMGIRLGDWEWKIFAAIPVVTLFFSYLFSVNVLFGVWTRSALAALLITMMLIASTPTRVKPARSRPQNPFAKPRRDLGGR